MTLKPRETKLVPPDGGWGWVVLFSALTVNLLIPGTVKSFGVLFVEFLEVFKASPTAGSWMPAMCYFLYSSLGPLSSILSAKYSYRTVTIIGGACAATGMMSSYFANSVSYLYISYGLLMGIGAGLTFPPTVYIVTAYFHRLRGLANGLCISGSAIGTIILPPFLQFLLNKFGYRGAVLIMGAITLNTIICGLLYHPVKQHMKKVPIIPEEGFHNDAMIMDEPVVNTNNTSENIPNFVENKIGNTVIRNPKNNVNDSYSTSKTNFTTTWMEPTNQNHAQSSSNNLNKQSTKYNDESDKNSIQDSDVNDSTNCSQSIKRMVPKKEELSEQVILNGKESDSISFNGKYVIQSMTLKSSKERLDTLKLYKESKNDSRDNEKISNGATKTLTFDFSVLKDPIYLVILISNSTSAISNTNFMILLPSYAIAEGFDKNMAAFLLSIVSILDLIGRISGASLSDIDFIPKYYYFVGGLGISGIALALLPMASSYAMLSFFCGLFGLSSGMYIGITTVILADMLGSEKLSSSYGISLFVNGVLQLIGPPICGVVFEHVGSYKPIFLTFGIILILGTALWGALPIIRRNRKKEVVTA